MQIFVWFKGIIEIYHRYKSAWMLAWIKRHELVSIKRLKDEYAFLPDHLALTETPASPLAIWTIRCIMVFFMVMIGWSYFSEIDIDVISQGKIISHGRNKIIQPLETGQIKDILVEEGQYVHKGDALVVIDVLGAEEQHQQNILALNIALTNYRIGNSVLMSVSEEKSELKWSILLPVDNKNEIRDIIESIKDEQNQQAKNVAYSLYQTWMNKNKQLVEKKLQYQLESKSVQEEIASLRTSIQLESKRMKSYESLYKKNYLSQHEWLSQKDKVSRLKHQHEINQNKFLELKHKINEVDREKEINTQVVIKDATEMKRNSHNDIQRLLAEVNKSKKRIKTTILYSPVDGRVQQLAFHTINGVVSATQAMMVIVPDELPEEVEVRVNNKDIGFIREGQSVVIKIDSFPYTRYGYLTGKIKSISYDSVEDEQQRFVFPTVISLDDNKIKIDKEFINLKAGMTVTTEIKTGKRRVIDYIISPLQTKVEESFWER
ncbi:HlyD family type I secretion periplasmic adaptor subunit [Xenorhabdus sp. Reich]|uniref:Membrane fusion protein (MFP) family protein n=1 Tax=Xenorhabdus littoralis TaxID=2582835 RepID=A0ABU4SNH3_9GAMM|nr:HlyD family type I secretion periplasmic adaptor subunit [Xenorhabdus sp. Reich]MDX8000206.1 HlyD family type I secretion periplasmic adaptor subunit [Xenorhabdus sp. Reich]